MNTVPVSFVLGLFLWAGADLAHGGSRSAGGYAINDSIDGGGRHVGSANYSMDGSVGGIVGNSSAASLAVTAKQGYAAGLVEIAGLTLSAPLSMPEGSSGAMCGFARLDDGSWVRFEGNEVAWSAATYPLANISGAGTVTAGMVYEDAYGIVTGTVGGICAPASILVTDSLPDNFGQYAGDGLPDSWQTKYYGTNNANAGPAVDLFGTGDNHFKYVAGLNPTNPASCFSLKIAMIPNQVNGRTITFSPCWSNRTYQVECRTNLVEGGFGLLEPSGYFDNGAERTVTDPDAGQPAKFYRVRINCP